MLLTDVDDNFERLLIYLRCWWPILNIWSHQHDQESHQHNHSATVIIKLSLTWSRLFNIVTVTTAINKLISKQKIHFLKCRLFSCLNYISKNILSNIIGWKWPSGKPGKNGHLIESILTKTPFWPVVIFCSIIHDKNIMEVILN